MSGPTDRPTILEIETATGPGRVHLHDAESPIAALVLGHGAGGGVGAGDLLAATDVALGLGIAVALVEQPYRAAGRRSPPRAPVLDSAWTRIVEHLRANDLAGLPVIVGGRSSGARVACRTVPATGAVGVLCLAFPLQPTRRATGVQAPSRLPELDALDVPVLIVQGARDPFGKPPRGPQRTVVEVAGDHGLKADLPAVTAAIHAWLSSLVADLA
jgi:predicted alpha/beta-hydrolase family hydrolase